MRISITTIIFIGVLLRISIAFWNGFFGPSPGADFDALGLNSFASSVATTGNFDKFSIGYTPYTNLLGLIYSFTIDHVFVGSLLSCFAWWLSANLLINSFYVLSVDKARIKYALLVYALVPSSIMFTAITIREPYQMLFVNLAIYAVLKIYLQESRKHWITLILAIIGAGVLHIGLLSFGILLLAGTVILVSVRRKRKISWVRFGFSGLISGLVLWHGFSAFSDNAYNLEEGIVFEIERYQQGLLTVDARTHYKSDAKIYSFGELLFFVPIGFIQYLFEPFPWNVSTAADGVLLMENILRGWLIWKAWSAVRAAPISQRRILFFILIAYLILEAIWSVGTINWGTSVRHHLPAWGLLLLAVYAVSNKENTKNYKNKTNLAKL